MPKQWDKQSANSAYMYIANGMYLKIILGEGQDLDAVLWLKSGNAAYEIMQWGWENIPDIEVAKDLARAALKLWLTELAEGV